MKYLSIDIETTGLDPEKCDILEVAAIIEDTEKKLPREECPTFHCYIDREYYNCDPFTCEMNFKIFKELHRSTRTYRSLWRRCSKPISVLLLQQSSVN